MSKYLVLGGTSAVALEYIRAHSWQAGDEIVMQYAHSSTAIENLQQELAQSPVKITAMAADFLDMDSTRDFVAQLAELKFIPTHVLALNAVPIENKRFTEERWEDFAAQMAVSVRAVVLILQSFIRKMAKTKTGKIVLVLSEGTIGVPPKYLSSYITSKYALLGLGRALASEYAGKIAVNMVSPAMMETKFLAGVYDGVVEKTAQENPYKRNCTPLDVANVLEFLFSAKNTFTTGANIPVTGGTQF